MAWATTVFVVGYSPAAVGSEDVMILDLLAMFGLLLPLPVPV
jgi:hypothetical protein